MSPDAAQKRIQRALNKLKTLLGKQGVTITAGTLATSMSSHALASAPVGLAAQAAQAGLASAAAGSGLGLLGAQLNLPFTVMKTQYALTSVAIITVSTPLAIQYHTLQSLKAEQLALRSQLETLGSVPDDYQKWKQTRDEIMAFEQLQKDVEDKERLEKEVQSLKADDAEQKLVQLQKLDAATAKLKAAERQKETVLQEIEFKAYQTRVISSMKNLGLAARIFANQNANSYPNTFEDMDHELGKLATPLEGYEFYPHERKVHHQESSMILFREKEPRFDGKEYRRAYTFIDGSVQVPSSSTEDFSAFEAKYTATPENLPDYLQDQALNE